MEVEAGQLLKIPLVELVQYKSNVYKQYQVQKKRDWVKNERIREELQVATISKRVEEVKLS